MPRTNTKLHMDDADKIHELYQARGGKYGVTGGFMNRGPERAIDNELWKECQEQVTGCKTLSERVARYKITQEN